MTKGCKILSIELPQEVLHQLTSEAQAPPYLGNRSKYARGILEGRHEKTITISPQAQAQADHYEQQLAKQAQEHQQQLDELLQAQQQQLAQQARDFQQQLDQQTHLYAQQREAQDERHQQQLDHQAKRLEERNQVLIRLQQALLEQQQAYDDLKAECITLAVKQGITEFHQEADGKELAKQTEKVKALTKAHKELQVQYNALKNQAGSGQQWFEWGTDFIGKNSDFVQAGLGSLLGGKATKPAAMEPSFATKLGERIITDFPGPTLKPITEILRYLRDTPQAKAQLLAQPEFLAYQKRLRANKAAGKGKPQ